MAPIKCSHSNQQGMILITVLLFLTLSALLTHHLFFIAQFRLPNKQVFDGSYQQFYAAEAGLNDAICQIDNQLQSHQELKSLSQLNEFNYSGYRVKLSVLRLPHVFCMLPDKQLGHYYRISAVASLSNESKVYTTPLTLEETVAFPEGKPCTPKMLKRMKGKSAWSQLNTN